MSDVIHPVPATPTATEAAPAPAKPVTSKKFFGLDDKYIAPLFITVILLAAQFTYGVLESPRQTLLAIASSIATELVLGRLLTGKWPHWASAYISGISVGILIRSPELWPYILCSVIAITSKYAIRVKGRHLWNPSNFAICAMLIIAHDSVATLNHQFDNSIYAMVVIWTLGSLIISRLRRFHICFTYAVSFIAFAFLRSALPGGSNFLAEVAPITGPMYQLYIFFMITDPKTTVRTKQGQILVAFLVAAMENVLRMMGNPHAPYFALTIVGPLANLVEIWQDSRKAPATPAAPKAATV